MCQRHVAALEKPSEAVADPSLWTVNGQSYYWYPMCEINWSGGALQPLVLQGGCALSWIYFGLAGVRIFILWPRSSYPRGARRPIGLVGFLLQVEEVPRSSRGSGRLRVMGSGVVE